VGAGIYCDVQLTPDSTLPFTTMFLDLSSTFTINLEASVIKGQMFYWASRFGYKYNLNFLSSVVYAGIVWANERDVSQLKDRP
jgi:hypothetical protein